MNCCDNIDDYCIIKPVSPNLIAKELKEGYVSIKYEENIPFEMKNANTADYNISVISIEDSLPKNLTYKEVRDNIVLSGIPAVKGIYEFKITIKASTTIYSEGKKLCGDTTVQNYKITIN